MEALKIILEHSSLIFVVLVLAALSGLISERAGVVNIGIEGMMTIGALAFSSFGKNIGVNWGNWSQIIALLVGGLAGMGFACFHAFASVTLKSDQIISGVAINILAAAIAVFVVQLPGNNGFISLTNIYQLPKIGNNEFFNLYLFLAIIVLVSIAIILKYTKWGLHHVATGENPNAVDAAGINVIKQRYVAVLLSGFLAGIAGGIFPMYASQTFRGTVSGNGFIALAILIFGQWRVPLITIGAALFAIVETTGARITFLPNIPQWISSNSDIWNILPFVTSLLVLVFTSKWSKTPKALGIAFNKSKR
ncbi:ABC transporter permease [Spiroplasma endosymbiont of Tricholauxania praeusta]|uniref:ABC transporter permease n=1 Tax=Spiroplasma endosymbiont of Tricholauxania praeusta TaxID=3066296 RepID=UPI0030D22A23